MAKLSRNSFRKSERGVTMLEYALLVSLASFVVITGMTLVGNKAYYTFETIADRMQDAGGLNPDGDEDGEGQTW